jgi:hypothetical protein
VSVLRRILRAGELEDDVKLVPIGSTPVRLDALRQGRIDATMTSLPWSMDAAQEGFSRLDSEATRDHLLRLGCGASTSSWLADAQGVELAYYRSIIAALTELYAPASPDRAIAVVGSVLDVEGARAAKMHDELVDPAHGWPPTAYINPQAIVAICRLRAENGQRPRFLPAEYYTHDPYRNVLQAVISGGANNKRGSRRQASRRGL